MSHSIGHIAVPVIILQVKKSYRILWFWIVFKLKISTEADRGGALRLVGQNITTKKKGNRRIRGISI